MPVAAVSFAGRPTVNSGSRIATFGMIAGWKMIFFSCVTGWVTTPARPTSEPVPAVVGTAMTGRNLRGIGARPPVADIFQIEDRNRLAVHQRDELADIEARAAAEGDDAVMLAGLDRRRRPR